MAFVFIFGLRLWLQKEYVKFLSSNSEFYTVLISYVLKEYLDKS